MTQILVQRFTADSELAGQMRFLLAGGSASAKFGHFFFIENRFFIDLDPRKASTTSGPLKDEDRDFSWDDENERLLMRPGVFLPLTVTPAAAPKH